VRRGLGEIHAALLAHVVDYPPKDANGALAACDELASIIVEPVETLRRGQLTTSSTVKSSEGEKLTVGLSTKGASLDAGLNESSQSEVSRTSTFAVTTEDKAIFPALHVALNKVLQIADARLYILFDEWSSIPHDAQPYLAEFLRRGVLPVNRAVRH